MAQQILCPLCRLPINEQANNGILQYICGHLEHELCYLQHHPHNHICSIYSICHRLPLIMACPIICSLCGHIVHTNNDTFDYVQYMCGHYVHEACFYPYNQHHYRICPVCHEISWVIYYG